MPFCHQCGKQVEDGAVFCSSCGAKLNGQAPEPEKQPEKEKLLLSIRPIFIPWVAILSVLPLQLFFTVWGGLFFGGFSFVAVEAIGLNIPKGATFVFFGLLFFFGIPLLSYFATKRTYEATEYRFYDAHLEYAEGFWTAENKSIRYKHIQEVSLQRGIIQKRYGLGTIYFSTPATGFSSRRSRSGIKVRDIPNAEKVYNALKKTIERYA